MWQKNERGKKNPKETAMLIPIFTRRQTFDSVAFVCVDGDVRMTERDTSVWKSDQMIHESTSLSQSHRQTTQAVVGPGITWRQGR